MVKNVVLLQMKINFKLHTKRENKVLLPIRKHGKREWKKIREKKIDKIIITPINNLCSISYILI